MRLGQQAPRTRELLLSKIVNYHFAGNCCKPAGGRSKLADNFGKLASKSGKFARRVCIDTWGANSARELALAGFFRFMFGTLTAISCNSPVFSFLLKNRGVLGPSTPQIKDGDGIIVCGASADDDAADMSVVELQQEVFVDEAGRHWLLAREDSRPTDVAEFQKMHTLWATTIRLGPQKAACRFEVAHCPNMQEYNMQLRWNLHDLYDGLGLTVHQKQRWTWVLILA